MRRRVALTRRSAEGLPSSSKLAVHVVLFDALQERTAELASGCEAAFCTMGVGQPRKVAFDEVWKVDVEYAGAFARGAAEAGVRHISLLSSVGANASSRNPYLRRKGAAEQIVERAGLARTSFFRPSLLVTRAIRYGVQDRVTQGLFPLVAAAPSESISSDTRRRSGSSDARQHRAPRPIRPGSVRGVRS